MLDELVDDGDEIVCLRAVEKDSRMASDAGIEEGKYRKEAERLLEQVVKKNSQDEKAISLVLELAVGKVEDIIQRMVSQPSLALSFHSDTLDPYIRTCHPCGRHTRSQFEGCSKSSPRLGLKILSPTLSHPSHRGPAFSETRKEKEKAPCRPGPPELQPNPRIERATRQPHLSC